MEEMQPRVNLNQLNQWSMGDDEASDEFLNRLVKNFVGNVPSIAIEMEVYHQSRDFDAIAKLAHILKGTSGNLGLMLLHEYCTNLEQKAKDGRLEEVENLIQKIKEEVPQTLQELDRLR